MEMRRFDEKLLADTNTRWIARSGGQFEFNRVYVVDIWRRA